MNSTGVMSSGGATRLLKGGAIAAVLAIGALALSANDASAQWRGRGYGYGPGAVAAGVLGGAAIGALAAGAANPYYYDAPYGPTVYEAPPPRRCWVEPEDDWNGYRWVRHNVRVCR